MACRLMRKVELMIEALDIQVKGIVQGVGFRPFVYRTAKKYLVNGWVLNATDGVFIHAEAESNLLDGFVLELSENPPAAAHVEEIELREVSLQDFKTFEIRYSDEAAVKKTTLVSPDLATCADCTRELFDPTDRRYRYPFINCTNCGPRFTIIEKLPYDRARTSMKDFAMCDACAHEYADVSDRRFHAQPDACFECGPHVSFAVARGDEASGEMEITWGKTREESDAIFARAAQMLCEGKILSVKGLGGFHLVCDAANAQAVATLRARKHREGKAFAVMMSCVDDVRAVCEVSEGERALLEGTQRPIVLLRKRADAQFAPGLADALPELGVMLPYTPVQHLLLHDFACARGAAGAQNARTAADAQGAHDASGVQGAQGEHAALDAQGARGAENSYSLNPPMLVMTSGNIHDEPIVIDDAQAYVKLADVADAFLGNDRAIRARYDDSVVRVVNAGSAQDAVQFVRRARGFAPQPLVIAPAVAKGEEVPGLLAAGPEQKNTFTLTRGTEAFVSQHIGDMENAETYDAYLDALKRFETLFEIEPRRLACDMHPEYLSTKYAREQAEKHNLPLVEVQHHHAHIVSAMAENALAGPVCGVAFDGTGYGVDGNIWGGEVMLANLETFERFANFAYVPMPGGAAAVKNPLRMAYGVLWAFDLLEHPGAKDTLEALGEQAALCEQMIERSINTPLTSSVGRLFDAASALLGVCTSPLYEGEPAILLEATACQPSPLVDAAVASCDASCASKLSSRTKVRYAELSPQSSTPEATSLTSEATCVLEKNESTYHIDIVKNTATEKSTAQDTSVVLFDAAPVFKSLLDDKVAGVPTSLIARRFHDAFIEAIVNAAELVRALYGIDTVVLSGGVFMNRYMLEHVLVALEGAGFTAAINKDLPPNDGCISFGQAVVALNS